jgi:PKD domain-containing protein
MDCSCFFSTLRGWLLAIALGTFAVSCGAALVLSQTSHAADPVTQANFKWAPAVAVVGQPVTFESTSLAGLDTELADYRWDLDGNSGYETGWGSTPVITTTYAKPGNVNVRLQVRDTWDDTATITKTISVAGQAPVASYTFTPAAPRVNDPVTFTSTASDADGSLGELVWDLNGDGVYDNGGGPTALRSFPAAGSYVVGLRVTDNDGAVSFDSQTIPVAPAAGVLAPAPGGPRLLSPFPVVRIAGRTSRGGVRIRLLSVDAPPGSTVEIRCKGRGCPFQSRVRATNVVRMRGFEKRLRAGVKVRIYVTSSTSIGKYTVFKIRKRQEPLRSDSCLMPGSLKPFACPAG